MGSNWPEVTLGEVLEIKYGKDHKKLTEGMIPCYGSGGVMRYVSEFLYERESILIPRKGSLNNIYFIDTPFWTVDTLFWSKINKIIADPKFIYYQLKLIDFNLLNEGSAVPSLTVPILKNIKIKLPLLKVQQEVSKILSGLDKKIELNQKTNQTLEQMAQALFKSWFVDFDPVFDNLLASVDFNLENLENRLPDQLKQKAQRRLAALNSLKNTAECKASLIALAHELQAQLPTKEATQAAETPIKPDFSAKPKILAQHANTHAHFPNEFEHNEQLGWIPKSWNNRDINSIAEITDYVANGSFASLKENVSLSDERGYALYIRTTDFKNEFSLTKAKYVSKHSYDFLKKSKLIGDEVIISNVGDVGTVFRPPIWLGMPMTLGSNAISLKSNKLNNYLYLYFSNDFGQYQIDSITSGSAQQKFNKTGFRKLSVLTPSIEVIDVFNTSYDELNYKLQKNKENTFSITSLRDALLPKLISGELQMPDVASDDEIVD